MRYKRICSLLLVLGLVVNLTSSVAIADEQPDSNTGSYVGYLYKSAGLQYKNAKDAWTSVPDIYVVPKSVYDTVLGNSKKLNESNKGVVAYCFNHNRTEPKNQADGSWIYFGGESFLSSYTLKVNDAELLYTMHPDVDGLDFRSFTDGQKQLSAEEFRAWVVSVGLNGYPNDYSGFNTDATGKQILSDDEFRAVTQLAIWHFTDDFDSADYYTWENYYKPQSEDAQLIYSKLIHTMLPESVTEQSISCLDIFDTQNGAFSNSSNFSVTNGSGAEDKTLLSNSFVSSTDASGQPETVTDVLNYQNLLAVSTQGVPDELASLTLKKVALDSSGAVLEDIPFEFTITIKDTDGNVFKPSENVIATDPTDIYHLDGMSTCFRVNNDGTVTVLLANNEALRISDLPYGYSYEITEVSSRNYETSYSVDGSASVQGNKATEKNVGNSSDLSTVVTFTNKDRSSLLGSLTIGKSLSPDSLDIDFGQEYSFAVKLSDSTYSGEVTDEENNVVGTLTNGEGVISLKAGSKATLNGVLPATHYSIQEINLPSQTSLVKVTTSVKLNNQNEALVEQDVDFEDNKVEGAMPDVDSSSAVEVMFENFKDANPGVVLDDNLSDSEDPSEPTQEPSEEIAKSTPESSNSVNETDNSTSAAKKASSSKIVWLSATGDSFAGVLMLLVLACVLSVGALGVRTLRLKFK